MMRKVTKMLALAAVAVLTSAVANANAILSIQADTTNLTAAGGTVNLTIVMTTGAEGVGAIGYNVTGTAVGVTYNSTSAVNVAVAPLGELSPPDISGNDTLGMNLVALVGGFTGGPVTIGTTSFLIGPNGGVTPASVQFNITGVEIYDNNAGTIAASVSGVTVNIAAIPEPGTLLLLGSGLVGLTLVGRRRAA